MKGVEGDEALGRETAELVTKLNTWKKDRTQLFLLDEDEYQHFFFVTNTGIPCEKVVISYGKHGSAKFCFSRIVRNIPINVVPKMLQ